ncbi:MAG: 4Fe-4S dicluster domain-containing protein [Desulfobacterales bacterium]|nr:MAG: 4Fe-4S dicluster domain-containing protein [Desulfobacterales bacterium]
MDRRTFLKIAGMGSLSIAAGCASETEKTLYSLVEAPDDMVTGKAMWYASTCRECPAGCGILAKNREGRVIKIEGNPLHPINKGTLCMRGQAALQRIYDPDRIKTPLLRNQNGWQTLTFSQALTLLKEKAEKASKKGPDRVRMLTGIEGESLLNLFAESLKKWRSSGPLVFEPFAYESLKAANAKAFGLKGLISYHMEDADLLISFGADFLETWLSPVEYAQKFKTAHAVKHGSKSLFFHVSPYQSLTGTNADTWMGCNPGGETAVVLGLIKEALSRGRGQNLPKPVRSAITHICSDYSQTRVLRLSGISSDHYQTLQTRLFKSQTPLILGTGSGTSGGNDLQTNLAVNMLNLVLDPELKRFDFAYRHGVETAASRSEIIQFIKDLKSKPADLLLLNNTNPVFTLPSGSGVNEALNSTSLFVVSFSNHMDETTQLADLIFPISLPLESWGEYEGKTGIGSTIQPAMGKLTGAPDMGDLLLETAFGYDLSTHNFKSYLFNHFIQKGSIQNQGNWLQALQHGGVFQQAKHDRSNLDIPDTIRDAFDAMTKPFDEDLVFVAAPSIRFFDGRGANLTWLCEIPDPLTKIAWHTPVLAHPQFMSKYKIEQGDRVRIRSNQGVVEAPAYEFEGVRPNVLVMSIGQGHRSYGRYAKNMGLNPVELLSAEMEPAFGGPRFYAHSISVQKIGNATAMAHTDGSQVQHGRKVALSVALDELKHGKPHEEHGLTMDDFPFTLPLPEGYDPKRDFYPPHDHDTYRWGMVIDLDRCIGCAACSAACYAENNLGVVGIKRVIEGREMAWLQVQRYHDPRQEEKIMFLPMPCQHCDNAPCESVCPVFAPHHSKEGLNNQIYNRCIGTRFCSQNCPYKVRRFNWFDWQWPEPLHLQLNPDVTVRSKGVMEKCSFCVQRIKAAHGVSKNENRKIRDGEVVPACVQTCPTGVFTFGNLMDKTSRVRRLVDDPRAYQVMGYLNTKPAVIYLKKVTQKT